MKRILILTALAAMAFSAPAHADWWKPTEAQEWQWIIDHALNVNNAADMGTGKTAFTGAKPPATDPVVYDIDLFLNDASVVAALHAKGKKVVCYMEVGAIEPGRPDTTKFQAIKPTVIGNSMEGYPEEHYIDIRRPEVVELIKARIKLCADKKFDAVEPDIDTSYYEDTGFPITQADQLKFMKTLSDYAHGLGLAFFGKNCTSTDDDYCALLKPMVDGMVEEECNQYNSCGLLAGYTVVFNAEYKRLTSQFCAKDNARVGWNGTRFARALKGARREPCK